MAIQNFSDKETQKFFETGKIEKGIKWISLASVAKRKLDMLHYAAALQDLRSPPANHLEALSGDLKGFYSIGINNQWRIVFRWKESGPFDVSIQDYH